MLSILDNIDLKAEGEKTKRIRRNSVGHEEEEGLGS